MSLSYIKPTHKEGSLQAKPAKTPFGYFGAKQRLAKQIIDMLPVHNAWVEGFCGSAALTLAKNPSPIEVINDLDGEIVNFFEQLRTQPEPLCEVVELTPYSKEEFEKAHIHSDNFSPLERARRFLILTMMTINATYGSNSGFSFSHSYSRQGKEARVNRWYNLPSRLMEVVERLRGVRVENRDARELVGMFADRPATLIYLDPPYYTKRDHGYVIDAKDRDFHADLLKECLKANCMLLISGYQNDLYDEMLTRDRGWAKTLIKTHTRDTTGKDYARSEIFWMNRLFSKTRLSGKLQLRLTKKELRDNKVNPPRKR